MRIATRLGTKLVSADFNSREYYTNIRKAITAGYFMQARICPGTWCQCFSLAALHGLLLIYACNPLLSLISMAGSSACMHMLHLRKGMALMQHDTLHL